MNTTHAIIAASLRWMHILFGIIWLGHLYFFNFVQANYEKSLTPDIKKAVVPQIRGRALWWFRWGAMITLATGLFYLIYEQLIAGDRGFRDWFSVSSDRWITFGMTLGAIMWFNVWFVIWPRQRVILASLAGQREKPADFDALVATAGKVSKINTYLSLPMLFGMGARQHFAMKSATGDLIMMAVVLLVGVAIAVHLVLHIAPKVGREFVQGEKT
ncbi:MAG TPA: urate hydroxylase PuuD [Planctomycetota bacterium]